GSISVDSTPDQGTTFEVWLPLPVAQGKACEQQLNNVQLPALNVLIADDVPQNLELLQLILQGEGHQVSCVANGREAVTAYTQGNFDLVLMGLHVPEVDGLQGCRRIRQREREDGRAHTPISGLTASGMQPDQERAAASGMDGCAMKPINVIQL